MFTVVFSVATFVLAAFAAQEVSINTPSAVDTCKEVVITWQHGVPPYNLSVVPGADPCDEALIDFPETNNTWYHWESPSLASGTPIVFALIDSTGDEVWSSELTIQAGSTTSCNSTSASADATATTLYVAPTAQAGSGSGSPSSPVVNPGSGLSAAPSSKGGLSAAAAGMVALLSVLFAL